MNGSDREDLSEALLAVQAGPSATIQDLGRPGYRHYGVPLAGAFDRSSHVLANALVGNPPDAATIEFTLFGGTFQALVPLGLGLAGAPMRTQIVRDGQPIKSVVPPSSFSLRSGDLITMEPAQSGIRTYLAVCGGWQSAVVLGARSSDERIEAGAILSAFPSTIGQHSISCRETETEFDQKSLRILRGPDATETLVRKLCEQEYQVHSSSNRVGLRLEGPSPGIVQSTPRDSSPVCFGTVQWTGRTLLILGPSSGTTGGYPHLGQVITSDLDRVAQLRHGDQIGFELIEFAEARRLDWQRRTRLNRELLRIRIRLSYR